MFVLISDGIELSAAGCELHKWSAPGRLIPKLLLKEGCDKLFGDAAPFLAEAGYGQFNSPSANRRRYRGYLVSYNRLTILL